MPTDLPRITAVHQPQRLSHLTRRVYTKRESIPDGAQILPHAHDWIELPYAVDGVVQVRTPEGTFIAPPNRALWIPPGVQHELIAGHGAEVNCLYLDRSVAARLPARCRMLEVTPLFRELVLAAQKLPKEYDEDGPDGRLVAVLLDQLLALEEAAVTLPLPRDSRLLRLCHALQRTPSDSRTLAEWAQEVGASERTLNRLFSHEVGMSFQEWRQRLRLLLALDGLQRGRPVSAVALDAGYRSASAFIAAFRRSFGKAPMAFLASG
jgi:AraC-like DNA-binding protein